MEERENGRLPLIGERAPAFHAQSTKGMVKFPEDYRGKWLVFFSHPADFTPVCTTEFITFAANYGKFLKLNCELLGLSIDSIHSHLAWLNEIQQHIEYKGMKNVEITFPVLSDLTMEVSKKYGMVHPEASRVSAVRAVFIIDPHSMVRAILYYPQSNGRNVDEILRLLIAMQTSHEHNVVTPANWVPGEDVIIPPPNDMATLNERSRHEEPGHYCLDWFLCMKKAPEKMEEVPVG